MARKTKEVKEGNASASTTKTEVKEGSVLALAKAFNKKYSSNVFTAGNVIPEVRRFSIGGLSADYSLNGGIPLGIIVDFAGPSGSCKTLAALNAVANYQKEFPDRTCVYVDAESTLPGQVEFFADLVGVQLDEAHFLRFKCFGFPAEKIFETVLELQSAENIGLIVVDSVRALISEADMTTEFSKDNGQRATIAKPLAKFCRFMIGPLEEKQNSLIFINHSIVEPIPGTRAFKYTEPCGHALNYYSGLKVRFLERQFTSGTDIELSVSKVQAEKGVKPDGMVARFVVTKSRFGGLDRSGGRIIYRFNRGFGNGVDKAADLAEIITKYGIAKLDGKTWYVYDPMTGESYVDENDEVLKFVGKPPMMRYFADHPEFVDEYSKAVSEYINKSARSINLLSEADLQKITKISKVLDRDESEESSNENIDKDISAKIEFDDEEEEA